MQTLFPTLTAGTGEVRPQYRKQRDGQGRSVSLKRVSCAQCGFPGVDLNRHDTAGGTLDGSGAGGAITLQSGSSSTDADGNQAYRSGGGCPCCYSRNARGMGQFDEFSQPYQYDRLR